MSENWTGREFDVTLGNPAHGGFTVGRHEGRVVFVRHGLPGERVRARVTEDRGGSFCRAEAVDIETAAPGRVEPVCPISGPGGAGCCDYAHASRDTQRDMKAHVVADQLRRIAKIERDVMVEELPGSADGTRWRTRVRLAVDADGRAGYHRYRGTDIVTDLVCPQIGQRAYDGLAEQRWTPHAELQVVLDDDGTRHVVEIAPAPVSRTARRDRGRRGATARRAAESVPRGERVVDGTGAAVQRVGERAWHVSATGFWQPHHSAATVYSEVVRQWAGSEWDGLGAGDIAWDLYGGVGVFAAELAGGVGESGLVESVEFSRRAAVEGESALQDLRQVRFRPGRVERMVTRLETPPRVVVLDPPRAGAGRDVVAAVHAAGPQRIVHVGCDPASFARDLGLYRDHGYEITGLRAFDAFPSTHHIECIAVLDRV
ncbi:TRAM domain-containing protein [Rhodococcus sp. HNM0569]|uniref:class I SAM-dependent RNA methyltransferase n=1 Tax=Rhodococcus sp. HNM0569 TaxID=2716340 RepID=UPI00146F940C|nr:TRAM domain-containing protein [Rhodococcus sp. HNM0569]NLU81365.1 class I SAM-dependent RNA methyltransferase [Rhodococcus sp. HNM0569]